MSSTAFPLHHNEPQHSYSTVHLHFQLRTQGNIHNPVSACQASGNHFPLYVLQTALHILHLLLPSYLAPLRYPRTHPCMLLYIDLNRLFHYSHQNTAFRFHLHNRELPYIRQNLRILHLTYYHPPISHVTDSVTLGRDSVTLDFYITKKYLLNLLLFPHPAADGLPQW